MKPTITDPESALEKAQAKKEAPEETMDIPDIGCGTMRTSGTYITVLLSLESRTDIPFILLDVLEHLKITPEKLIEFRDWNDAGGYTQEGVEGNVEMPTL